MNRKYYLIYCCLIITILFVSSNSCLELTGFYDQPGIYKVFHVDGNLSLKCTADELVDIVWYKKKFYWSNDDFEIKTNNHYKIRTNKDTKTKTTTSELYIKKTNNDDNGEYSCRVEEKQQKFLAVANVVVAMPSSVSVTVGKKLRLHCNAFGYKPIITWSLPNNVSIEDGSLYSTDSRITVESEGEGIEGNVVVIDPVDHEHSGNYFCEGRSLDETLYEDILKGITSRAYIDVFVNDKVPVAWVFIGICAAVFLTIAVVILAKKDVIRSMLFY